MRHFAVLGLGRIGTTVQDSWKDMLIGEAAAAVIPLLADKQEQVASAAALSLQNLQNDDSLAALIPYVLEAKGTPGNWRHITRQIGMFSYTGLSAEQCTILTEEYAIYLLKSGRISIAGLNHGNVQYVVDAIDDVVRRKQPKQQKVA